MVAWKGVGVAYVGRRLRKAGKTVVYLAMWREHAQGKEQSKSFERKADAERHLVDMQRRLLTGTYAPPRLGRTQFSEVALRYRQRGNWRPRTHRTVEERLRYAVAHFGDRPIASIRKGDLQSFVSGLPLAPNTVRVVMQHVSGVFNTALDDGLLGGRNPCDGVRLPRVDAPPVYPMSIEQVDALISAAAEPFKAAIVIGAGLGLRQSEAAGLTVDRVNFLRRSISVDRQWQQATGSAIGAFTSPKTEASTHIVPADQWVLDHLAAHIQQHGLGADSVLLHRNGVPFDSAPRRRRPSPRCHRSPVPPRRTARRVRLKVTGPPTRGLISSLMSCGRSSWSRRWSIG